MTTSTIELADEVVNQLGEGARCMGTTAEELLADCANQLIEEPGEEFKRSVRSTIAEKRRLLERLA